MRIRKLLDRIVRERTDGTNTALDVDAAISANVGEGGSQSVRRRSHRRIVQRDGQTVVSQQSTDNHEETR